MKECICIVETFAGFATLYKAVFMPVLFIKVTVHMIAVKCTWHCLCRLHLCIDWFSFYLCMHVATENARRVESQTYQPAQKIYSVVCLCLWL